MTATRYWEITCDYEFTNDAGKLDNCTETVDTMEWFLTDVRKRAQQTGWTRGPGGEDLCPKHKREET